MTSINLSWECVHHLDLYPVVVILLDLNSKVIFFYLDSIVKSMSS